MCRRISVLALFLLVVTIVHICADVAKARVPADGLVSYWSFSNTTIKDGVVSDLAGSNDGTIKGDPKMVQGKIGQALLFDGDGDHVDCGNDPSISFDVRDAFSTGAWVNIDLEHNNHMIVVGKMESYGTFRGWTIWFRGLSIAQGGNIDHIHLILRNHQWIDNNKIMVMSETPVPRGEWVHLVMTYDGSRESEGVKFYVDGEDAPLAAADETAKKVEDTIKVDTSLNIGARGTDKGQMPHYFNGIIDEVFIYNRDLTADEVKQIFEADEPYAIDSADKLTATWGAIRASE